MGLVELLKLCKQYRDMGGAVQEQLDDIINGVPVEDLNPRAVDMIANFLEDVGYAIETLRGMDALRNDLIDTLESMHAI